MWLSSPCPHEQFPVQDRLLRSCTKSFAWGGRNLKMSGALVCTSAMEVTTQFAWELPDRPCKHDQQMVLSHPYEAYPAYPTKSYPWFFSHFFHRSSSSPYLIPRQFQWGNHQAACGNRICASPNQLNWFPIPYFPHKKEHVPHFPYKKWFPIP